MKSRTTTLLAATLITLLTASQSAMALNESTAGYELLMSSSKQASQMVDQSMFKASYVQHDHVIGNSENGADAAYVGTGGIAVVAFMTQDGHHAGNQETNFLSGENSTR